MNSSIINDKLIMTARILEKVGNLLFERFGISMGAYEILIHISSGEDTTVKLASAVQSSLANITHKTQPLEKQGYIKRLINSNDKRISHFSLTPEGIEILETIKFLYSRSTERLYSQFSEDEKDNFVEFLSSIENHLRNIIDDKDLIQSFVTATLNSPS